MSHFLGIDIGTGSARAGLFDAQGQLVASARAPITTWEAPGAQFEQSSAEIWAQLCGCVRQVMADSGLPPEAVGGLGFDATCSLVVVDAEGQGLPVGASEDPARDIILWMDHRATGEAAEINAGSHRVLDYLGGAISPEMEIPKLLWLKRHRPEIFARAAQFFDLADYLGWRATGSLWRSSCTLTCKWTWTAHLGGWDAGFLRSIGLGELTENGFARIGATVVPPGTPLPGGLSPSAAADLGLLPGTPVGAGLIDAHAGGFGSLGGDSVPEPLHERMAYVFGTSACTMASSLSETYVPGVWGPYQDAMLPGMWLLEGGQSAAGAAIARLVRQHPAWPALEAEAKALDLSGEDRLADLAAAKFVTPQAALEAVRGLHVLPEFNGNRAPHADPEARAVLSGLGMEQDLDSLLRLYVAGIFGIGYGLRQIIAAKRAAGLTIRSVVLSGGAARHDFLRALLADAADCTLHIPRCQEPVLLGAALLGAIAAGAEPLATLHQMGGISQTYRPGEGPLQSHHADRLAAFEEMQAMQRRHRSH